MLSVQESTVRPAGDLYAPAELSIATNTDTWLARAVINATGTWNNPVIPDYPGKETFLRRQLHTRGYRSLEDFQGQRVAVVGVGIQMDETQVAERPQVHLVGFVPSQSTVGANRAGGAVARSLKRWLGR